MQKKIHTAFSFSALLSSIAYRLGSVVFIFYIFPHFDENPSVIGCLIGLVIFIIVSFGEEQIVVYEDRVDKMNNSFMALFIRSKKSRIAFVDIQKAYLEEVPQSTPAEIGVAVVIQAVMPKTTSRNYEKPIYFLLKNGETVEYNTELDRASRQQIVDIVNGLIK